MLRSIRLNISPAAATFDYDYKIKQGEAPPTVNERMKPYKVNRESRDSNGQAKIPIGVIFDTTGSMQDVPKILQERLPKLFDAFISDKKSGKNYLGNSYPDILMGAVDDFDAMRGDGALQVGQFESGIEIDDDISRLWLTGRGGGSYEESYELAMYFFAKHTANDHWDRRRRKGYLFLIGDEHAYPAVSARQIREIIGDSVTEDIPLEDMVKELRKRYHTFFIIPNMTSHYGDKQLLKYWTNLLGQQNVLELKDPTKICEMIVGAVAICENYVGVEDVSTDFGIDIPPRKIIVEEEKEEATK
jgi:hypothetical protein